MKGITHQDYEHTQQGLHRITPAHENITLGDYHDVYLATDVLLSANILETFWNVCLEHYKFDPAQCYTAPYLAWKALSKTAPEYCEHEKRRKDCK